jgi:hypothetical protein
MSPGRAGAITAGTRRARFGRRDVLGLPHSRDYIMLGTVLIVILVLMLIGALPTWGYSRSWGYAPTGVLGLIVLILLVMLLTGRL